MNKSDKRKKEKSKRAIKLKGNSKRGKSAWKGSGKSTVLNTEMSKKCTGMRSRVVGRAEEVPEEEEAS